MALADERDELLRAQARARAAEHRRRQAERAAAKGTTSTAALVSNTMETSTTPDPDRALSAQERHEAAELAANRRTIWLPEPVVDPVTGRRVFAYDPQECPTWLAAELAKVMP